MRNSNEKASSESDELTGAVSQSGSARDAAGAGALTSADPPNWPAPPTLVTDSSAGRFRYFSFKKRHFHPFFKVVSDSIGRRGTNSSENPESLRRNSQNII